MDSFISDSSGLEVEKKQFYISKTAEIGSLSMFIPIVYQGFVHPTGGKFVAISMTSCGQVNGNQHSQLSEV